MENTAAACSGRKGESQNSSSSELQNLRQDRISELPNVVIHDILARLQSHKQAWQAAVLSKRWTRLLSSYPILEFEEELVKIDYNCYVPKKSVERFAKARVENFSRQQGNMISMEAVRVKVLYYWPPFYSELHDRILELAGRCSLREIDISFGYGSKLYRISKSFLIPSQPNSKQFLRLRVIRLSYCDFYEFKDLVETDDNPFSALGSSLKELCLEKVIFPYGNNWVLNSMIAGAYLLERLTLVDIIGINTLQIRNHENIKVMEVTDTNVEDFEITGAPSLERLSLIGSDMGNIHISSTPNLKALSISEGDWDAQAISKLTADIPSLESLKLNDKEYERVIVYSEDNDGEEVYSDDDNDGEVYSNKDI